MHSVAPAVATRHLRLVAAQDARDNPAPAVRITRVLGVAVVILVAFDLSAGAVALPETAHAFRGARPRLVGLYLAAALVAALVIPVAWRLTGLLDRRRMLHAGVAVLMVGSLGAGFASTSSMLFSGRLVQGLGAGLALAASLSVIAAAGDVRVRRRTVRAWGFAAGLVPVAGLLLGWILVAGLGWRSVFLVNVPATAAILLVGHATPDLFARRRAEYQEPSVAEPLRLVSVRPR